MHDTLAQTPAGLLGRAPTEDGTPTPAPLSMPAAEVPLIGRSLGGKYQVKAIIGRGGLGTVFRGVQAPIGREVAIKVINRQRADDPSLRKRFQREAAAAAHLKHPGIVALYDFGEDEGELYMVMELVDGRELRQLLTDEGRMAPSVVVELARQICEGLAHAHERGLVHRDMKPENIMVSRTSFGSYRAQILDFGIVKSVRADAPMSTPLGHQTRAGVIMGTPAYLSPEQAYARGIGPATDQYSLGVMLYEMLTGQLPYHKGSEFEVMTAHCIAPFPPMPAEAEVPAALEAVVRRAMAKTPEERFPDVQALADALADALAGRAAPEPAPAAAPSASPPSRRGLVLVIAALALGEAAWRCSRRGRRRWRRRPRWAWCGWGGGAGERAAPDTAAPETAAAPGDGGARERGARDGGARERGGRDGGPGHRRAGHVAAAPAGPGHRRPTARQGLEDRRRLRGRVRRHPAELPQPVAVARVGPLPARRAPGRPRPQRPVQRAHLGHRQAHDAVWGVGWVAEP
ncbi:MAG: serine/threonine protein kinase [Myxococcales bacterium]|nr:serine/threonine protein kinase [Myxococcales bacterium]